MSNHALVEESPATADVQVIAELATAALASIARMHADGAAAVTTIAETPVRLELPPVAEAPAPVEADPTHDEASHDEPAHAELTEDERVGVEDAPVEAELVEEGPVAEAEDVVRISEPLWVVPPPRGRHLAEALTDQLPAQNVA
ncbi:hypothetical protein [Modestobacter italicus]|uniref:hypothetical protein n=1 Tax=Modestobacter italicus (strain DSM 44449 / CECT 9708 / BC 501) TaxID=2732864 RepID=UPI001C939AC1|nr:hypothetical protein [Modestobacter italicus]